MKLGKKIRIGIPERYISCCNSQCIMNLRLKFWKIWIHLTLIKVLLPVEFWGWVVRTLHTWDNFFNQLQGMRNYKFSGKSRKSCFFGNKIMHFTFPSGCFGSLTRFPGLLLKDPKDELQILSFIVTMNHFESHLMVSYFLTYLH